MSEPILNRYDVYWNPEKPAVTLYVPHDRGLPDLADADKWTFDSTVYASEVPADLARQIDADGHAFRNTAGE